MRARRQRGFDERRRALLHEVSAFVEGAPHLGIHLSRRERNETGDHASSTPPRAAARWLGEHSLEAFMEHGRSILSVFESARRSDSRQQRLDVMTERLGSPRARGQRAKRVRGDHCLGQPGRQPAV